MKTKEIKQLYKIVNEAMVTNAPNGRFKAYEESFYTNFEEDGIEVSVLLYHAPGFRGWGAYLCEITALVAEEIIEKRFDANSIGELYLLVEDHFDYLLLESLGEL